MSAPSDVLPYLTADLPGTGGRLKVDPKDFIVEEIPAYQPSGSGEHLFLWVEKIDLPHDLLLKRLSKVLDVSTNDIGTAGIKDRRAVTRQYVSVPIRCVTNVDQLNSDDLHVLKAISHGNKLRTGHLQGNRFIIVVRDIEADGEARAQAIAAVLRSSGFPNYYGEQRFGIDRQTLSLGLDLLSGKKSPRDIPFSKRKFLLRLALSSVQSDLFNRALARRLNDGLLGTVLSGDILEVVASGGKFIAEDAEREQARLNVGEVVITGPMFGVKMLSPNAIPADREAALLQESGLTREDFGQYAQLLSGTRRPYVVNAADLAITSIDQGIRVEFTLPAGTYATVLLRELMKPRDE